ncbi:MAG: DUF3822 family protein [Pricia sp.]
MTTEETNNKIGNPLENTKKLSIQVSLNGLSFCVLDTSTDTVLKAETAVFAKKRTPYGLLKHLKSLFLEHDIRLHRFSEVIVIHRNNLFGLVPQPLFDADELPNYLKLNTKILANDHMAYDTIESLDMVNVFVPFVNINNYIYEGFGAFTFKHHGTVILESLSNSWAVHRLASGSNMKNESDRTDTAASTDRTDGHEIPVDRQTGRTERETSRISGPPIGKEPFCYLHIFERQMDIAIFAQRKLLLFNCFEFVTKEDFLYYLLFTLEQLQLDPNTVTVKLFGDIEEDDDLFELCYRYIRNVTIIIPAFSDQNFRNTTEEMLDFTILNAL